MEEEPQAKNYYTNLQNEFIAELGTDQKLLMVDSVAAGADTLTAILQRKAFIQYDLVTGLYRLGGQDQPGVTGYTEIDAKNFFLIVIAPLIKIITGHRSDGSVASRALNKNEQEQIWTAIRHSSTFDSRRQEYDEIPEWDGTERIATFMEEYFECECNNHQFLLFLTCVMAKWRDPRTYVGYFFDLIGESKSTGKTSLFEHLFGRRSIILGVPSRKEDLFVSAYTNAALVVVDDECTWIGKGPGKMSYDEFKSLVTQPIDTYSRKHAQPESHYRPFVIVRTSNDPRTVFSTNERRQIIFNVGLPERECRHWNMTEEYRRQLLAEAKDYVEKHNGQPYKLTKEEENAIEEENLGNYDTETEFYQTLVNFFGDLRNKNPVDIREFTLESKHGHIYTTWKHYAAWCKDRRCKPMESRIFWRQVAAVKKTIPGFISYNKDKKKWLTDGTVARVIEVLPIKQKGNENDDIPD